MQITFQVNMKLFLSNEMTIDNMNSDGKKLKSEFPKMKSSKLIK